MNRRKLRENIFKLLFLSEFNNDDEMPEQLSLFFDAIEELADKDQQYMQDKYEQVKSHLEEIDGLLNNCSSGWKTSRMSKVDLAILRLAVYEVKFDEDIPESAAINEAVELAKRFGGDDSPTFVNGILGAM
jgi:transcription antitermination factor NusB